MSSRGAAATSPPADHHGQPAHSSPQMNMSPSVGFCMPTFMHWNAHPIGPFVMKMQSKMHVHFASP